MYIHDLNCSWLQHDFVRNRFVVADEGDVRKVRAIGVREIDVDTERGLDPDALPATAAEPGPGAAEPAAATSPPVTGPAAVHTTTKTAAPFERACALHREATQIVRDMLVDIRLGKQIEMEKVEPLVGRIVDSIFTQQDALLPLARLKQHDTYTFQHSVSVCALMTAFARTLEVPREVIREIAVGALLHDVGKARVPDQILNKPGKLTEAEFDRMKSHVVQSKIILQATPGISPIALDVAAQHHERYDGTGYPNKLKGEQISLYGRMGAIVDVYDAITSNRVYRPSRSWESAVNEIKWVAGTQLDPKCVDAFVRWLEKTGQLTSSTQLAA